MTAIKLHGVVLFALSASLLAGCGLLKKKQPEPAPSASQVAIVAPPPAPAPPVPAEVTVADEAIAAPEDFEDEAFEKVSDKTYKSELDSLKKDIEAK
jgi:hypothetical protein